ncbi:unnamed protein product [Angiostrongylus costaricensis]|uniref:Cyclic nucleotide-binding domain-containing protein n=1 Tax=Angiostrongylus costaricensis TaxID=334426 RepID=A0A0R3PZC2_ANGCS|nr:unnamed protein product [Angiostrongylus costaricensis]
MSQLERELIERAKERGVDRVTARQTLTDKLLWKEKGEVATIRMQRWALLVLSKDSVGVIPNEICAVVMENGEIVGEMRLIRHGFQPSTFCDTNTMRLDRIMCLEDVITVFRQINERSTQRESHNEKLKQVQVDIEEDEQYEQLRDLELSDTILFARAAAEYFARAMKMCTLPQPTFDSTSIIRHHNPHHFLSQHDHQLEQAHLDISDGSSTVGAGTQVAAQGDICWTIAPPKCSQPELYPLALEPPRQPISGRLATNPFNKPANIQAPERGEQCISQQTY